MMRRRHVRPRSRATVFAGVGLIALLSGSGVAAPPRPLLPAVINPETIDAARPHHVDHLYRIVGKVRPLFFWVSADDVGGARMTWRATDHNRAVSLLIGSEPQRAPREVNEWGYILEDMSGDATYHHVDRVLDVVERNARWKQRHTIRPAGVAPGFLTALDLMMRSSAASARATNTVEELPRLSYVYKDAVYDLIARRVEPLPWLQIRSGVFRNLLRTEISVRSRAIGSVTRFVIIYGTEGPLAGVPVYAQYQPNWWFKVELELDESRDVPVDPAGELSVRHRIDALCGSRSQDE